MIRSTANRGRESMRLRWRRHLGEPRRPGCMFVPGVPFPRFRQVPTLAWFPETSSPRVVLANAGEPIRVIRSLRCPRS